MFKAYEFVDKSTYERLGDEAIKLMDNNLLLTVIEIRRILNMPMIINDWYFGKRFQQRGYRSPESNIGTPKSAHRLGKAVDFDAYFKGVRQNPDEIREKIIKNRIRLPYLAGLELGINWVHIDTMQRSGYEQGKILTFYPEAGKAKWI
jgi:hypothetical protein